MRHITRISTYYQRKTAIMDAKRDLQFCDVIYRLMNMREYTPGLVKLCNRAAAQLDKCNIPAQEWLK